MSSWLKAALLFALTFALALLLAQASDWTGTEVRRAGIAREMLWTGDYLVPHLGGEVTLTKPPLHYWMQAASFALFGESILAARLPAALLHSLLVAAVYLTGLGFGRPGPSYGSACGHWRGPSYAFAAALLFAIHPILLSFAVSAEIDGPFAALIGLALLALLLASRAAHQAEVGRAWAWSILCGLLAGCALLSKGPPLYLSLLPAWILAWRSLGFARTLTMFAVHLLPMAGWALLLWPEASELASTAAAESVGRTGFFTWGDLFEIPGDFVKMTLLTLPLLLVLPWRQRSVKRPELRLLLVAGLGAFALLAFFPHRPTRYALPGIAPLLFWLAHASGPWLELELPRLQRLRPWLVAGLLLLALALWIWGATWVFWTPLACVLAGALLFVRRGLLGPMLALSVLMGAVECLDKRERNTTPPRGDRAVAERILQRTGEARVSLYHHVPPILIWLLGERADNHEFPSKARPLLGRYLVMESQSQELWDAPAGYELILSVRRYRGELRLFERRQ
ncbi:MAG: hypothetical protein CSA62_03820 [Planctomycetota bacterium]|nr:MAG: hypothetical protein CSA62_03820 [Planctomycetota bacterium]